MIRQVLAATLLGVIVSAGCGTGAVVLGAVDGSDGALDASPSIDAAPDAVTDAGPSQNCTDHQGTCVALAPSSCPAGVMTALYSCGGGVGVTCCVTCPELTPLPPGFCDGGPTRAVQNDIGCTVGFECAGNSDAGPAAVDAGPPACVALGGTCKAIVPGPDAGGPCGSGTALGPDKASCGGGIGVTCCIP